MAKQNASPSKRACRARMAVFLPVTSIPLPLPNWDRWEDSNRKTRSKSLILLVGAAGFEPTTCSTQIKLICILVVKLTQNAKVKPLKFQSSTSSPCSFAFKQCHDSGSPGTPKFFLSGFASNELGGPEHPPISALKISASSLACLACSEAQSSLVSIQSQSRGDTYALQFLGSFLLSSLVRYRPQIWQNALSRSVIRPRGRCHRARR
jgi:hypothetical protein